MSAWDDHPLQPAADSWEGIDISLGEPEIVQAHPATSGNLPAVLAADVSVAVRDWTNPDEVGRYATALRSRILDGLHEQHGALVDKRPADKRFTEAVAAPELTFLAQASSTLDAVGDAIKAGAKQARDLAGEVVVDIAGGQDVVRSGSRTVKVADEHGGIRITRTQATAPSVRDADVLDVLVAYLVGKAEQHEDAGAYSPTWASHYAQGLRDGIAELQRLVSPVKWKTTALEGLEHELEAKGQDALAIRLSQAVGRVPTGNPRTTVERTEVKP